MTRLLRAKLETIRCTFALRCSPCEGTRKTRKKLYRGAHRIVREEPGSKFKTGNSPTLPDALRFLARKRTYFRRICGTSDCDEKLINSCFVAGAATQNAVSRNEPFYLATSEISISEDRSNVSSIPLVDRFDRIVSDNRHDNNNTGDFLSSHFLFRVSARRGMTANLAFLSAIFFEQRPRPPRRHFLGAFCIMLVAYRSSVPSLLLPSFPLSIIY
jgi:hypothetical protein